MAWAADSRISKGLASTITQLQDSNSHIVFISDGQEAPPVNPRYKTDFSNLKSRQKGMLVGVGGLHNVPIPKYNNHGQQQGFYKQDDVPHRSTFGMAPTSSVPVAGYNARNAPFGSAKVTGDQHLTRLYESYLQQLSKDVDWSYHRLDTSVLLNKALQSPAFAKQEQALSDSRPYFAIFTLILLALVYFPPLRKSGSVYYK